VLIAIRNKKEEVSRKYEATSRRQTTESLFAHRTQQITNNKELIAKKKLKLEEKRGHEELT
jgi:hypothetical protein